MRRLFLLLSACLLPVLLPAGLRSDKSLKHLLTGNNRHVRAVYCQSVAQDSDSGQPPLATVLTCCDAGFAPERIFDLTSNQLYVVRSLAHVVDSGVIGALEYGVGHRQTPLLVILGHQGCAALQETAKGYALEGSRHLQNTLRVTLPALLAGKAADDEDIDFAAILEKHVRNSAQQILENSAMIQNLIQAGELNMVMGVYRKDTGMIRWLKPQPKDAS